MVEAAPALIERNAPVEADDVGSGLFHPGQKRAAACAKINDWRSGFLQLLHHVGDVRKHIAAVNFPPWAAKPTVAKLNEPRSRGPLPAGIPPGQGSQRV